MSTNSRAHVLYMCVLVIIYYYTILLLCYVFQGQFFSGGNYRVYLLGNPIIWWGNLILLFLFLNVFLISAVFNKRGISFLIWLNGMF